jgi:carboxylesterase type B
MASRTAKTLALTQLRQIYKFSNIRFAAPPTGELRWAKPAPPNHTNTIETGEYGPSCIQASIGAVLLSDTFTQAEDCLFLDLYVPGTAVRNSNVKLPVVVWIYGGAYGMCRKDVLI